MRPAIPLLAFIGSLVAVSVVLAGVASAFAMARPDDERLDADLASLIRADYSADPEGTKLAPLGEGIIDVARQDEDRLREISGVEIVPVFILDGDGGGTPGDGGGTPGDGGSAPGDGGSTPGDVGSTPGDGGSTPGDGGSTPGDGGSTPGDGGSTPGDGGSTPGSTPAPAPTPLPAPGPTPAPSPAPPPPGSLTFFLHNDPSPPTWHTASHATLPMDLTAPTPNIFFNYDTDRDGVPGLIIARGGSGAGESDATKYQAWRTPVLASDLTIQGTVVVELWSAMKAFNPIKSGTMSVYLRDFDGSGYVTIASASRNISGGQGGAPWVLRQLTMSGLSYTLPAGHRLELKLVVDGSSDDDMWFAYDTAAYSSRVTIN